MDTNGFVNRMLPVRPRQAAVIDGATSYVATAPLDNPPNNLSVSAADSPGMPGVYVGGNVGSRVADFLTYPARPHETTLMAAQRLYKKVRPTIPNLQKRGFVRAGIYLLYRRNKLVYIGQGCNVLARIAAHQQVGRRFSRFSFIPCKDKETRELLESILIREFSPEYNLSGVAGKPQLPMEVQAALSNKTPLNEAGLALLPKRRAFPPLMLVPADIPAEAEVSE